MRSLDYQMITEYDYIMLYIIVADISLKQAMNLRFKPTEVAEFATL